MSRKRFNAQIAQYKTPTNEGNGFATWDNGVKCYLPSATIYGLCSQASAPTPDAPVDIKCNNGTYRLSGKNLIKAPYRSFGAPGYVTTVSGITYTVNNDFSVTANGTSTGLSQFVFVADDELILASGNCHLSGCPKGGSASTFFVQTFNGYKDLGNGVTISHAMDKQNIRVYIQKGTTVENLTFYPQLEIGTVATPYEPYFGGGSVTAPFLHGIPNTPYQDEWNAVTGVGIRRCGRVVLDGNHDYWGFAATTDGLGYSVTIKNVAEDMRAATYGTNYCVSTHHKAKLTDASAGVAYGEMIRHLGARHVVLSFPPSCTSVELCKAWLAEQYNAGTPVTLIYDLATPVTFYSEPTAKLIQPNGYGTLIQTAGDVPNCPVSVKYLTHS